MTDRKMRLRDIALRFVTGAPLSGKRRTNATFVRAGQVPLGADQPARWSYLPGIAKAAIRILALFYVFLLFWAWFNAWWVIVLNAALLIAACVSAVWLAVWERRAQNAAERMPMRVTLDDKVREILDNVTTATRVVVGFAMGMVPVLWDLEADAPHFIACMGTGGGKSTLIRGLIAQMLANGTEKVVIVDVKLVSLQEWKNHPQVDYHIGYAEMWDAIVNFRLEMDRRYQILSQNPDATFPRWLLIIEEGNSFATEMRMYWNNELGGKGPCPLMQDIALILFKARQACMNVIGAYQRLSVQAVGTPDARDMFGFIAMTRFRPTAWKSIIGTTPIPHSPRWPGRGLAVVGAEYEAMQMIGWKPVQAIAYAAGPVEDPDDAAAASAWRETQASELGKCARSASDLIDASRASSLVTADVSNTQAMQGTVHRDARRAPMHGATTGDDVTGPDTQQTKTPPPALPDDYLITMQEAVLLGLVTSTYAAMRSARQRGTFPAAAERRSGSDVFTVASIREWEAKRVGDDG